MNVSEKNEICSVVSRCSQAGAMQTKHSNYQGSHRNHSNSRQAFSFHNTLPITRIEHVVNMDAILALRCPTPAMMRSNLFK